MSKRIRVGVSFSPFGNTYGRYGKHKFDALKQHGYDGADINAANTDTPLYTMDADALADHLTAEREAARQAGIAISQVHGPWRWPPQDGTAEQRAERMDKMKRAVTVTALLGCDSLVIHPLMPYGIEDIPCGKGRETWEINVAFFTELVAYAKEHDVTVCIENMPMRQFSLATPQRLLEFVQTVRGLRICLDTGHVAVFPHLSVGDEIRRLGGYIRVFHIHDNHGEEDSHLFPTQGRIDWADFAAAAEEIGYDGVLSLETAPSGGWEDAAFAAESIRLCETFRNAIHP